MIHRLTKEQFVERAKAIHGDTYDYSETVYSSMEKPVVIKCRKHGEFRQLAGNHIDPILKAGCPYCGHRKVFKGETDLKSNYPSVAKYFDEEKNGCKADEVFANSNKKYWWKCDKGHSFEMPILSRIKKDISCPYCSGQRVLPGFNDLTTVYPDIAREWDYEKNAKTPSDYSYGSGYKAWWICEKCGHSYQSYINVHIRGHKCPYCSGKKVFSGMNDLQTLFPDIAKEYSPDNEKPVNQISPGSHKKVKWICPHCRESYMAAPHHRTLPMGTGCPHCNVQSKGERRLKDVLNKYHIEYKEQEQFDDLRNIRPLKFDFTIYNHGELVGAVEYNGEQHYRAIELFGGEAARALTREKDGKKIIYCLSRGIPILEIAYDRPHRFMTIEDELVRFLRNLNLIEEDDQCESDI